MLNPFWVFRIIIKELRQMTAPLMMVAMVEIRVTPALLLHRLHQHLHPLIHRPRLHHIWRALGVTVRLHIPLHRAPPAAHLHLLRLLLLDPLPPYRHPLLHLQKTKMMRRLILKRRMELMIRGRIRIK